MSILVILTVSSYYVDFVLKGDAVSDKNKMLFVDFILVSKQSCYISWRAHNIPLYLGPTGATHSGPADRYKSSKLFASFDLGCDHNIGTETVHREKYIIDDLASPSLVILCRTSVPECQGDEETPAGKI